MSKTYTYEEYKELEKEREDLDIRYNDLHDQWKMKVLLIAKFFELSNRTIYIGPDGEYVINNTLSQFYPSNYVEHNEVYIEKDRVSISGYRGQWNGMLTGKIEVKIEDLFRDDWREYFSQLIKDYDDGWKAHWEKMEEMTKKKSDEEIREEEIAELKRLQEKYAGQDIG